MNQAGSGLGEFYSGPIYQRGYGVGSFLGGLFKSVLPILKRGGVAIGKEVLKNGTNFINDVENNANARTALTKRAKETVDNLKSKLLYGEGFKSGFKGGKRQLCVKPRKERSKRKDSKIHKVKSEKIVKKKQKRNESNKKISDIFSKNHGIH